MNYLSQGMDTPITMQKATHGAHESPPNWPDTVRSESRDLRETPQFNSTSCVSPLPHCSRPPYMFHSTSSTTHLISDPNLQFKSESTPRSLQSLHFETYSPINHVHQLSHGEIHE